MANEYVSVDQLKPILKIDDADDDSALVIAASAASKAIESFCHRRFWKDATASARLFTVDPSNTPAGWSPVVTGRYGITSLLFVDDIADRASVQVAVDLNGTGTFGDPWEASDFQLEPLNADVKIPPLPFTSIRAINNAFPMSVNGRASVKITAKWGWPAVPAEVPQAALIACERLFKRKDAPFGVMGSADVGFTRISNLLRDPDLTALLSDYVRTVFA